MANSIDTYFKSEGAADDLAKVISTDTLAAQVFGEDHSFGLVVNVAWATKSGDPVGTFGFTVHDGDRERAQVAGLVLQPAYQDSGLYTHLTGTVPAWLRSHGVNEIKIAALGLAKQIFVSTGFEQSPDDLEGTLRADISTKDSRLEQYSAWRSGKGKEPQWHKGMNGPEPSGGVPASDPVDPLKDEVQGQSPTEVVAADGPTPPEVAAPEATP